MSELNGHPEDRFSHDTAHKWVLKLVKNNYSQTCVKRSNEKRHIFGFFRQVVAYCCMKVVQKAPVGAHSAISNHLSIAISMSPECKVA